MMVVHLRKPEGLLATEVLCVGPFARWMHRRGWAAFTLPLPLLPCVIFYWMTANPHTRVHEFVHVAQRQRYGWWGFLGRYLWGLRRGYRRNPLEVEAYATTYDPLPPWAAG